MKANAFEEPLTDMQELSFSLYALQLYLVIETHLYREREKECAHEVPETCLSFSFLCVCDK